MLKLLCKICLAMAIIFSMLYANGCSTETTEQAAKESVEQFYREFNAEQFQNIYALTDKSYRANLTEQESAGFFKTLHSKFGKVMEKKLLNVTTNYSTDGVKLILTYNTIYELGQSSEQFIWKLEKGKARLVRYDMNPVTPLP